MEQRSSYTRPIHLHLRSTYLQDVHRLSPELHRRLMAIATPIAENWRMRELKARPVPNHIQDRRGKSRSGQPCPIWARLSTPPERHVRLDHAERLFLNYLQEVAPPALNLQQGAVLRLEPGEDGYYRVLPQLAPPAQAPDLIVIAEGGKSASVRQLGLKNVRFSYPKYFMSAHVPIPYGPRTRRLDVDVRKLTDNPATSPAEVSLWASGHGDVDEGTWVVLEVPEALLDQETEQAEGYFLKGLALLMEGHLELPQDVLDGLRDGALLSRSRRARMPGIERASRAPFAGTFKFEQQCLRFPAAGKNLVVLGDAAGMGHHALSSGLEMGACDLGPLGHLCERLQAGEDPGPCIAGYAEAVFESRLRLLSLGMNEYYPQASVGGLKLLHRAIEVLD